MATKDTPPRHHEAVPLPAGVRQGDVFAGKYRIGPVIGEGAMGIVVAARHLLLNEKVAIKFMTSERWQEPDAIQRFVQEARAAVRIQNQHVVRVLDVAVLESGAPYLVMEYLEGTDLAKRLRAGGPLALAEAVAFLLQASEAVSESHRIGIVHRDLKPANLFIVERAGSEPLVKVLDFGISKSTRLVAKTVDVEGTLPSAQLTEARSILGSPFYMSPEQMESARDVDARTDIWALGVTLFELVTGKFPFGGSSLVQVYCQMMSKDAGSWRAALVAFPGLETVIARCLASDREDRYASVADFVRDLAPFGAKGGSEGTSLKRGATAFSDSSAGVVKAPRLHRPGRAERARSGRNLVAAVVAGFAGSALFVLGARTAPSSSAAKVRLEAAGVGSGEMSGARVGPAATPASSTARSSARETGSVLPSGPTAVSQGSSSSAESVGPPPMASSPSDSGRKRHAVVAATMAPAHTGAAPAEGGGPLAAAAPPAASEPAGVSAGPLPSAPFTAERVQALLHSRE